MVNRQEPTETSPGIEGIERNAVPTTGEQLPVLAEQTNDRVQALIGPQMREVKSISETVYSVPTDNAPNAKTDLIESAPASGLLLARQDLGVISRSASPRSVSIDPAKISKDAAVVSGSIAAGVGVTSGGLAYVGGMGAASAAVLGGLGALQAGSAALAVYGGGLMHDIVWNKPGSKKHGKIGTFARGIISPISVPVGLVARTFRSKEIAA